MGRQGFHNVIRWSVVGKRDHLAHLDFSLLAVGMYSKFLWSVQWVERRWCCSLGWTSIKGLRSPGTSAATCGTGQMVTAGTFSELDIALVDDVAEKYDEGKVKLTFLYFHKQFLRRHWRTVCTWWMCSPREWEKIKSHPGRRKCA